MADSPPPFSATALMILGSLRPHTPFAEAILRRQAERAGLAPSSLREEDLAILAPLIVAASALFVDPPALVQLKRDLRLK